MTDPELETRIAKLEAQNRQLHLSVSAILLAACLLLGLWNLGQAQHIGRFTEIFDQMLSGKQLPVLTTFVIEARPVLFIAAIFLPLAAVGIFFSQGRRGAGIGPLALLVLLIGAQALITRHALWRPIYSIISELSHG